MIKNLVNGEWRKLHRRCGKVSGQHEELAEIVQRLAEFLRTAKLEKRGKFAEWLYSTNMDLRQAKEILSLARHLEKTGKVDKRVLERLGIIDKPTRQNKGRAKRQPTLVSEIAALTEKLQRRKEAGTLTEVDRFMLTKIAEYAA